MSKSRFTVVLGSYSGHCCFEASVIDTTTPDDGEAVCECVEVLNAHAICASLNSAHEATKDCPEPETGVG